MNLRTALLTTTILRAPADEGGGSGDAPAPAADAPAPAADAPADPLDTPTALSGAAADAADPPKPTDGPGEANDHEGDLGEGDAEKPNGDAKPEGEQPPAAEVKFDVAAIKPPEGYEALDADAVTAAAPLLAELGVETTERAQEVIGKAAPIIAGMVERQVKAATDEFTGQIVATRKEWAEQTAALFPNPEAAQSELAHAARFLDTFGGEPITNGAGEVVKDEKGVPQNRLRILLRETGIGDHPDLVTAFIEAGKRLGEAPFHREDEAAPQKKSDAELFYPGFKPRQQ